MLRARSGCHFHHPFERLLIFMILKLLKAPLAPRQQQLFLFILPLVGFRWAVTSTSPFLPFHHYRELKLKWMSPLWLLKRNFHHILSPAVSSFKFLSNSNDRRFLRRLSPIKATHNNQSTVHFRAFLVDRICSSSWMWKWSSHRIRILNINLL